jgi:hypothetical protein
LQSIDSLKRIPGKKVYFVECTDIPEFEEDIKSKVYFYRNIYKGNESIVDGPHKGLGFALSILSAETEGYENIYVLAGRYYLTDDFNYSLWDNEDSMMWVDESNGWRLVTFFKINKKQVAQFRDILLTMIVDSEERSIEQIMMAITDFKEIDKVGVEGYTHGGGLAKF